MAAAAFTIAWIMVQLAVPLLSIGGARQARFGWQMYSRRFELPSAWVVLCDGSIRPVPPDAWMADARPEVRYESYLPGHLCRAVPGAEAALVRPAGASVVRHPCS